MATVVVPFVENRLHPETARSVRLSGLPTFWARLDPLDDGAYARLFVRLWASGRTFIVCEHDIVPTTHQWRSIACCGRDWCFYDYDRHRYADGPKFGLARFSRRLTARLPDAARIALTDQSGPGGMVPWWRVDSAIARDLTIRLQTPAPEGDCPAARFRAKHPWAGSDCHRHAGRVAHMHVGPPSGPG